MIVECVRCGHWFNTDTDKEVDEMYDNLIWD